MQSVQLFQIVVLYLEICGGNALCLPEMQKTGNHESSPYLYQPPQMISLQEFGVIYFLMAAKRSIYLYYFS